MKAIFGVHSPFRIFAFSSIASLIVLAAVLFGMGMGGLLIAIVLTAVEIAFSFDNAILNAKILSRMSRFWQSMFLSVGAIIAIFGMRIVFPILIVAVTAHLGWGEVLKLALQHPDQYAQKLEAAHPAISAFGGAFLLMLALHFFVDDTREVRWLERLERQLQRIATHWGPPIITLIVVGIVSVLPGDHHRWSTAIAGALGVVTYAVIHGFTTYFGKLQTRKTQIGLQVGAAAFISFLYLEVLDASFSFDGVLGAFAVTNKVVLIAAGLGIGALWVRSLTIFMVRRGTLDSLKFVEHGAHYTIAALAVLLFVSIFVSVPEAVTGLLGIGIIAASVIASRQALKDS
jgi:hypothetical protein